MIEIHDKERKSFEYKKVVYTCASCGQKPGVRNLGVYLLELKGNGKSKHYAILCNSCRKLIEDNQVPDDKITGYAQFKKNQSFVEWMLGTPFVRKDWHRYVYGGQKR